MSRHVPREVAAQIPVDKLEVFRQDDGMWRWRWIPGTGEAEPLLAAHGFESAEEAEESARSAYPRTTRVVVESPPRSVVGDAGRTARHGCGAALATVAVGVLVAVRRHRSRGAGS